MKENGFRIFGDELDREEAFVDVELTGVNNEGEIFLYDKVADQEWVLTATEIQELFEYELAVGSSNIPLEADGIWKTLQNVSETRNSNEVNDKFDNYLKSATENIFRAILQG